MARKRSVPDEDEADLAEGMTENSNTDDEEMLEEGEDPGEKDSKEGEVPFMDTFYGLASSSPADRAQAAHIMLYHCLLGPSANSKDAAYAFHRLLNGLCSGRAAARQGYASALTSFLKVANQKGVLNEIQEEQSGESVLVFLRNQLVKTTDPMEVGVKKKGSEERDHHFGRLFGILSVIRSGVLLPKKDQADFQDMKDVASGFMKDLIELYGHRKWMREPTAYAVINLLDSFYELCPQSEAVDIVKYLVADIVLPELLSVADFADYSAEQIAVALNIQSQAHEHGMQLPSKLKSAILTTESVPVLAKALSSTSIVSQPRAHVVWDVIWCPYLSVVRDEDAKYQKGKPVTRVLRKKLHGCKDSAEDVIESLVEHVIMDSLLGVEPVSGISSGTNATHERRALALSLVKVLCGSDSVSKKAGHYRILVDGAILEKVVLTPVVVQKLFIDVITGGGKQTSSLLRPMTLRVLESIVVGGESTVADLERRLSCAKALLSCESRFDGKTKTATCLNLVLLDEQLVEEVTPELTSMWMSYVDFLQRKVLEAACDDADGEGLTSHEAIGYIDLLFNAAKKIIRLTCSSSEEAFKITTVRQILAFLFVGAFFDCANFKSKEKDDIMQAARTIKNGLQKTKASITHGARRVMSARFYSLLADFAVVAVPVKASSEAFTKSDRDFRLFEVLCEFNRCWARLENARCKRFCKTENATDDPDTMSDQAISDVVFKQQEAAVKTTDTEHSALQRFRIGCASLGAALRLHLLQCGEAESPDTEDEIELDEEDGEAEVKDFISDLAAAQHNLMGELGLVEIDGNDLPENALQDFAELCVGVLTAQLGITDQSRGASPKLLRETVKTAWSGALLLCCEEKPDSSHLTAGLVEVLLASIGHKDESEGDADNDSDFDNEADSTDQEENDEAIFTQATTAGMDVDDDEDQEDEEHQPQDEDKNDESDSEGEVELDSSQLQSLLLQESDEDDDEMVLEHHAGADKALAKLIQIKQEARKAGQQAIERSELSNNLRCTILIEVILSNPGNRLDSILTVEFVQGMIVPLLSSRRKLEKALLSGPRVGKKTSVADNEKRALVEKISSLLKTKLFKLKTFPALAVPELVILSGSIADETRKAGTDGQLGCCAAALIAVCKMAQSADTLTSLVPCFSDLLREWSTKRTTRLKTSIFADIIEQQKSMAQILLCTSLCEAGKNARSSFLKSEAFRLLGALVSKPGTSDMDMAGRAHMLKNCNAVAEAILAALEDSEMKKAKRVRDILKTCEKLMDFSDCSDNGSCIMDASTFGSLKDELLTLKVDSDSTGVVTLCQSLCENIEKLLEKAKQTPTTKGVTNQTLSLTKKKKKGKKGKKK